MDRVPSLLATTGVASAKIALLVGLGALLERRGVMTESVRTGFSKVVCTALLPALTFVVTVTPLQFGRVLTVSPLFMMCVVSIGTGLAIGRCLSAIMPTVASKMTTTLLCAVSNSGAVPMMLMVSLCKDKSLAMSQADDCSAPESLVGIYIIPFNVFVWTLAYKMLAPPREATAGRPIPHTSSSMSLADEESPPAPENDATPATDAVSGQGQLQSPSKARRGTSSRSTNGKFPMKRSKSDIFEADDNAPEKISETRAGRPPMLRRVQSAGATTAEGPPVDLLPAIGVEAKPPASPCPTPPATIPPLTLDATSSSNWGSQTLPHEEQMVMRSRPMQITDRAPWAEQWRKEAAGLLVRGTQYELVPMTEPREEAQEVEVAITSEGAPPWILGIKSQLRGGCAKAKQLAALPVNAATLLGILVGICPPVRALFMKETTTEGSGEGAPLGALTDTLWVLGAGTNPSLMLLLGASLGATTRSALAFRSQQRLRTQAQPDPLPRDILDDAGLQGIKLSICAVTLAKWILMPLVHIGLVVLAASAGGIFVGVKENPVLKFILLCEGALPPSMTILAVAVEQKNKEVEKMMGVVLVVQYLLAPVLLTISSCVFLFMVEE